MLLGIVPVQEIFCVIRENQEKGELFHKTCEKLNKNTLGEKKKSVEVKTSNLMSTESSRFKQHFKLGGAADSESPRG